MPGSSTADTLAEVFEGQRARLHAVAHRMLGSHADAEDVVQEAWLRLSRQDAPAIGNLPGWLTTVVGRISLDVLRTRRSRPQASYDDGWPELAVRADDGAGPEDGAALADALGAGLLVVLASLRPDERLAFVLHDLFAVPFAEIARILGRSAAAAKMLGSRARAKVQAAQPPAAAAGPGQRQVVDAFLAASRDGDFAGLLRVLDPQVRLTVDTADGQVVALGATRVASGARTGADAAGRGRAVQVLVRVPVAGGVPDGTAGPVWLPGFLAWRPDGSPLTLAAFAVADGRITAIRMVTDPALLASLELPAPV
ncbi:sigma-70 family RNA polymerase sigma factor [Streptomyces sp. NRRL F-5123]|uniref:sigma-70 family RNA polymerase sigma factor n=1 Tax=Streptomyces sp. NRRL F-5123 TaxID=1463856 RepID=UPI0004E19E6A|nr:sigma-70 family RNA polymerase sigma factor [Streptomyces sp. NRRL F-5123]